MQRLIAPWIAACVLFTLPASCNRDSTPQAVSPPKSPPPAPMAEPLTGSNSQELPTSAASPPGAGQAQETTPPAAPLPATALEHLSDAQIVGIAQVETSSEVDQAKIARMRAARADTKQFAAMMIGQDQQSQQEQAKLGIPSADSPTGEQLRSEASSTLQKLQSAIGDDFDRVYFDAQVDELRQLLSLVESRLQPDAKDAKLKAYLERIRSKIQMHLQRAEMQQAQLTSNSTPGFIEAVGNPRPTQSPALR